MTFAVLTNTKCSQKGEKISLNDLNNKTTKVTKIVKCAVLR